jgi:DNA polymerase-3 subunit epsilon
MTREVVLDTETTGLSPREGDRVVEIGCVELINHIPTGRNFHVYLNPERNMPEEARRIHGLDDAFLADKALFKDEVDAFLNFIADATLVIHNAPFDMGFLNAELDRIKRGALKNEVIDTVKVARKAHPGARVSLDALCKHYGIDNSRRTVHGALLDSEILAEVYLELLGGRQVGFALSAEAAAQASGIQMPQKKHGTRKTPWVSTMTEAEKKAHADFVASMGRSAIWQRYLG